VLLASRPRQPTTPGTVDRSASGSSEGSTGAGRWLARPPLLRAVSRSRRLSGSW
jgi:hypothetical protein